MNLSSKLHILTQTTQPQPMSTPPLRPRLVLRAGFAGRRVLSDDEQACLQAALLDVFSTLGDELAGLAPGVPVREGGEPRVAPFFARGCPLLRLVTGLCEGADAVAAQVLEDVHVAPDADAVGAAETPCLETELAAVLPFDVATYRESRPVDFRAEFDRQLARCEWVLALDGIYEKPDPPSPTADRRRARAYRAQSAFLLRNSDVLIAAVNPDDDAGRAGGTLETVRDALAFGLPVVFIHTGTGAVRLVAPEQDLHSTLADPNSNAEPWREKLRGWVVQMTVDPASGLSPQEQGEDEAWKHGKELLEEYFDRADSPTREAARPTIRFRKWAWGWFEKRFQAGQPLKSNKPLAPYDVYRNRAASLSRHYSGLYRGAFLLNYVAAIAAVFLAAMSLVLLGTGGHTPLGGDVAAMLQKAGHDAQATVVSTKPQPWLHGVLLGVTAVKLLLVIFISRNTRRANKENWNDRAVDFRYLAERLRGMNYLPLAGSQQPPAAAPPQFASRVVRQSAADWLFDAIVRAVSPGDLEAAVADNQGELPVKKLLTPQPLRVVENVRDLWIAKQAEYHDRNARTMHGLHHVVENVAFFFSWAVILVVGIDLVLVSCELLHLLSDAWEAKVKVATPWLIFTSAVLPAIVAALGGIRFQSECQRLAERSGVMRVMLAGRNPHVASPEVSGWWNKLKRKVIAFCKTALLVVRHLAACPPDPPRVALVGGRWALADTLAKRIAAQQADESNLGSWSLDALRLTERVATDFVQEAAEWSVLYAKEVSDPG